MWIYGIKSYPFRPSLCFFVLYVPFYGIYNYILLFPVSLVIIIIIIIIIVIIALLVHPLKMGLWVVSQVCVDDIMLAGMQGASHSGEQEVVFLFFWLIESELARASRLSWKNETICKLLILCLFTNISTYRLKSSVLHLYTTTEKSRSQDCHPTI